MSLLANDALISSIRTQSKEVRKHIDCLMTFSSSTKFTNIRIRQVKKFSPSLETLEEK